MDNIRMAARVCQGSFRRILYMPRFYIAFLWLLFLYFPLMNAVRSFSAAVGIGMAPWMFPFLTDDSGSQLFIILGALLLFCDAPFLNQNSSWQILRAGRKNWFWGNMAYIWLLSLVYAAILSLLPVLLMIPHLEWTAEWGKVLGTLAQTNALGIRLNYTIMAHYTPAAAMLLTLAAVWLNTVLIGMINFTLNLLVKKGIGAAVSVAAGLSPLLIVRLARFDLGYYFAPPLWMDLSNYRWQGYGYGPSFAYVYGVLLGCIGVCTILSLAGMRRKDLNFTEEV